MDKNIKRFIDALCKGQINGVGTLGTLVSETILKNTNMAISIKPDKKEFTILTRDDNYEKLQREGFLLITELLSVINELKDNGMLLILPNVGRDVYFCPDDFQKKGYEYDETDNRIYNHDKVVLYGKKYPLIDLTSKLFLLFNSGVYPTKALVHFKRNGYKDDNTYRTLISLSLSRRSLVVALVGIILASAISYFSIPYSTTYNNKNAYTTLDSAQFSKLIKAVYTIANKTNIPRKNDK